MVAVMALAVWCALRAHRRGDTLGALLAIAFLGLLASPVSWTHHWVWLAPLLIWLLAQASHNRQALALALLVGAVTLLTPFEWVALFPPTS
jgi:alpha-1,2-mannosyltransferase